MFSACRTRRWVQPRAPLPSWLTIPGYFWLAGGRRWHFFFAWIFALNGLLYVIYNIANGGLRKFLLTPKDAACVPAIVIYQNAQKNTLKKASIIRYKRWRIPVSSSPWFPAHHTLGNGHVAAAQYGVPVALRRCSAGVNQRAAFTSSSHFFSLVLPFGHVFMVLIATSVMTTCINSYRLV